MKTFFKTYATHAQRRAKWLEFEKKTGLKWDAFDAHGGVAYTPIVTRETPMNEDAALALLPYLTKEYCGFVKLAEISGLSLEAVLIGAKTLAQTARAVPNVNRNGKFAYIRSK